MKYWYFNFEGRFSSKSKKNAGMGLFSGCLIPCSNYVIARAIFLRELRQNEIDLLDIVESFVIDGEALDPSDMLNEFWIEWYKRCQRSKQPLFDKWHVYEEKLE